MARGPRGRANGPKPLVRPQFVKTPFGGVPAPKLKSKKAAPSNVLLPSRKALDQLAKPGTNIQEFDRLSPIGSGALDQDFTSKKTGF